MTTWINVSKNVCNVLNTKSTIRVYVCIIYALLHILCIDCCNSGVFFNPGMCYRVRMHGIPELKTVDRWTEKRSMFGVYDNIGILGEH